MKIDYNSSSEMSFIDEYDHVLTLIGHNNGTLQMKTNTYGPEFDADELKVVQAFIYHYMIKGSFPGPLDKVEGE